MFEVELGVLDLMKYDVLVFTLEWKITAQKNIHENSEGPNIALLSVVSF
jgi:hypothetical protein